MRNKAKKLFDFNSWLRTQGAEPIPAEARRLVPGDGQWKMPHAQGAEYWTAHRRRLARLRRARWKHGLYSAEARAEQKRVVGETAMM